MPNHPDPNTSVHNFVDRLSREGFYGTVSLSFQSGNVVNIRKEQNLKPQDLVANSKGTVDAQQFK